MGNRAVICHESVNKDNANEHLGIYVHWNGSVDNVEEMLSQAKEYGIRNYTYDDQYCMARLCQIVCEYVSNGAVEDTSVGIGLVSKLDCHNYDNGVYYFDDDFEIVNHTDGSELERKE